MIIGTRTVTRHQHQHQRISRTSIQFGGTSTMRRTQSAIFVSIVSILLLNTTYLYHFQPIPSFVTATSSSSGSITGSSSSRGATTSTSSEVSRYIVSETSSSNDENDTSTNTIIPMNDNIDSQQQPTSSENSIIQEEVNNDVVDTQSVESVDDIADDEKILFEHDYDVQQRQQEEEHNEFNDIDDCCHECEYYDAMYTNNDDNYQEQQQQQQQQSQEIDKYDEELYYQQNQNQEYTSATTNNNGNNQYPISGGEQTKNTATSINNSGMQSGVQSYTDPTVRKNSRQVLDAIIGRTAIPIVASLIVTTIMNSIDPILQRHLLIGMSSSSNSNSHNLLSSTSTTSSSTTTTPFTTTSIIARNSETVNHCFLFLLSILNYIPTITASMVASAVGTGNYTIAQEYVSSSLFVCYFFGIIATCFLFYKPHVLVQLILPQSTISSSSSSTAADSTYNEIIQSLRIRAISIIPILISSSAFAGFRGSLDTITPFKVSLVTQIIKLTLQPLLSLSKKFDKIGYDLAITISDVCSGLLYVFLMTKRRLLQLQLSIRIPSIRSLLTLIGGGLCLFSRQTILNIIFLFATNRAQQIQIHANAQQSVLSTTTGSTGSSSSTAALEAIAYSIVNKVYFGTSVVHIGMQATAATLVPFIIKKFGLKDAQYMAERINVWGTILGMVVGLVQYVSMPYILLLYIGDNSNSKLSVLDRTEIQSKVMSLTTFLSLFHIFNGSIAVGEGTMVGLGNYIELILISLSGLALIGSIIQYTQLGQSLIGIGCSILIYYLYQTIIITLHQRYFSPLKNVSTAKLQQISQIQNDDKKIKENLKQ